ncbi:hypothetical protein ROJ8625_02365 [Roseivivax jejudonensis]|uniref:Uncharacterized protein n=1 Tax=Roseivivax jejudonensis TaxID=1529041 RepID=A0A1X6ZE24_9RHOB|nr:hypothetical protein [Roseivivax jejudonensis]SLN48537.1 hypothetical protein ROJ8625_02365 [Roseivivax jejudonensis]
MANERAARLRGVTLGLAVGLGLALATGAAAQQDARDVPAEFPPDSYDGRQYVDSRGCAYIRAGIDGAVTWVPRVTRTREHICGLRPTLGGTRTAATDAPAESAGPAPRAAPASTPRPAPAAAPARAPRSAPPAPVAATPEETAARAAPAPERRVRTAPPLVRPVPAADRSAPPPVPQARPLVVSVSEGGCDGRAAAAAGYRVRCVETDGGRGVGAGTGVRAVGATTGVRAVGATRGPIRGAAVRDLPPETRILPLHVARARDATVPTVPPGYRPAWDDGRLNPHRANQSLGGFYATQRVWTNTVPRRAGGGEIRDPVVYLR